MGKIIGIDLGTTNSCVAVMEGNEPVVIINSEGKRTTPSVVAFADNGERKIGDPAKRQAITNPQRTIYSIKRFMGESFDKVALERNRVSYVVEKGDNNTPRVKIDERLYTPQEISAMVLQKMKKTAEDFLGQEVTEAVITVPAYFSDSQRQATKEAGEIAGLKVRRIINEPTAAALAYGLDKMNKDMKVAVYDLGGGTFDISILELGEGVYEVKATNGDTHLGGDDFDKRIVNALADDFKKEHGVDLTKDVQALQRLRDAAEKAKIELSTSMEAEINLPFITQGKDGPVHLVTKLSRAKLESLVSDLIDKTIEPVKKCLADAKIKASDINEIVMVGGMTRMPKVYEKVKEFFGKEPNSSVNPDEVVAIGAAVQGGVLAGDVKDVVLLDVTPLTLGLETLGSVSTPLISRNTTVPTSKTEIFSTAADNQTSVEINILQGERPMAADNKSLGRFVLSGIPPAPRGVPQIEVTFDIDASGILAVTAKDKATGKVNTIKITGSTGLSKDEVERMRKEAEEHASEDAAKKEQIEVKNKAENLLYVAEKTLKDAGDKAKAEDKTLVEEKMKALKDIMETGSKEDVEAKTSELSDAVQKVGASMYQGQQPGQEPQPGAEAPTGEATEEGKPADEKKVEEGQVVS